MTAKEFVKTKVPTAAAEKQIRGRIAGDKEVYWLIRERGKTMYLASGETESKAWKKAKELILKREAKQKADCKHQAQTNMLGDNNKQCLDCGEPIK